MPKLTRNEIAALAQQLQRLAIYMSLMEQLKCDDILRKLTEEYDARTGATGNRNPDSQS